MAKSRPDSTSIFDQSLSTSPPTSSSSRPSTSSYPSSSSTHSNLPKPPPAGRQPPAKGRLRLGRRKESRKRTADEEEWTLEDGSRASMEGGREELVESMGDSGITEKPKESKGKRLAHKTSQLFSRKEKLDDSQTLSIPSTSRQTSFSSTGSAESSQTSGSNPFRRPVSHHSPAAAIPAPQRQHSRRISGDSWHGVPRTARSGSSSTDSPAEQQTRRQSSNLSASVPSLSRNALPQPSLGPSSMSTRMSTWFTHLISTSTSPDTVVAAEASHKPPSVAANFLNAARQRAVDGVRQLLDTEAQPDKLTDTMWLMGLPHPGYQHLSESPVTPTTELPDVIERRGSGSSDRPSPPPKSDSLRPTAWPRRKESQGPLSPPNRSLGQLLAGSTASLSSPKQDADSPGRKLIKAQKWPEEFYNDFRTRIWCSYRSQYAPIMPLSKSSLLPSPQTYHAAFGETASVQLDLSSKPSSWGWAKTDGLTSDAGWGCMLRTGQSLLANALINLHLGREWRLPDVKPNLDTSPVSDVEAYATYVRIISYFMDDPSPLCPFSVHRMALIGKELGKEVGEWFGPSTASGALKTLADAFPPCGLAVTTAADGTIYKSDVFAASSLSDGNWVSEGSAGPPANGRWGHKAVLILVGLRLGLDGVNPIYHDSIKALFTFPQSVGIAGGRPNTSYYFVASQANHLFYLDPHFTRPAIPLVIPPATINKDASLRVDEPITPSDTSTKVHLDVVNVDDLSDNSDNSLSPTKNRPIRSRHSQGGSTATTSSNRIPSTPSTPLASSSSRPADVFDAPTPQLAPPPIQAESPISPRTAWYLDAYTDAQLRTFHSDKVRKMPLSGLDPSMLLGFLIRDEADFEDFCMRTSNLPQKIFAVQDEPPSWDEDDAAGLESVSEPDLSDESGSPPVRHGEDDEELLAETKELTLEPTIGIRSLQIPIPLSSQLEDEWESPSSFPRANHLIDRSLTPNSAPVLVETPTDMPQGTVSLPNGQKRVLEEPVVREPEAVEDELLEDTDIMADMGSPRRPAPGVRGMRQRTDSWVKPDRPDDFM